MIHYLPIGGLHIATDLSDYMQHSCLPSYEKALIGFKAFYFSVWFLCICEMAFVTHRSNNSQRVNLYSSMISQLTGIYSIFKKT